MRPSGGHGDDPRLAAGGNQTEPEPFGKPLPKPLSAICPHCVRYPSVAAEFVMTGMPIADAAAELGVSVQTLRRWIVQGCPVFRRGGRGRGKATLLDPQKVRAWRDRDAAQTHDIDLGEFSRGLPLLLAGAIDEAFRLVPAKRDPASLAFLGAAAWQLSIGALHDAGVDVSDDVPPAVDRLRKIAQTTE